MSETNCPECKSTNINEVDDIDLGAFIILSIPIWGSDWQCNDCGYEWSTKLLE